MKNLFKSMLTIVLACALCITGFAADPVSITLDDTWVHFEDEDGNIKPGAVYEMGTNIYFPVKADRFDDLKNFKIKKDIEIGNHLIGDVEFVHVKDCPFKYALMIEIKCDYEHEDMDVIGEIILEPRHNGDTLHVVSAPNSNYNHNEEFHLNISNLFENAYLYDFDNENEYEIEVEANSENIIIEADVRGQEPLYIKANDDIVKSIFNKYPEADLLFVNFEGDNKTFYRTCTMYIPYEYEGTDPYIYERTENGLKLIEGAYDVKEEEFIIKTKTLNNYIISDRLLVTNEESEVKPVLPNQPINPPTGAVEDAEVEEVESNNSKVIVSTAICVLVLIAAIVVLRKLKKDGKLNRKNK